MKKLILIFYWFLSLSAYSQSIHIEGAYILNNFFDNGKQLPSNIKSNYPSGNGYEIKFSNTEIFGANFKLKNTLSFTKYAGHIELNSLSNYPILNGFYEKSLISIGIYPINFSQLKHFDFSFGVEFSKLLNAHYRGQETVFSYFPFPNNTDSDFFEESSKYYIGQKSNISFNLKISEAIYLTAAYNFYLGFTKEFIKYPSLIFSTDIFSIRNGFSLGLKRNI